MHLPWRKEAKTLENQCDSGPEGFLVFIVLSVLPPHSDLVEWIIDHCIGMTCFFGQASSQ